MEWIDAGIVLATRRLGESAVVLSLLTSAHGRHAGMVPGGTGRQLQSMLQPGNRLKVHWRARLAEQLGLFVCELAQPLAPAVLSDRYRLMAVTAACAIAETALPEREPHPRLFDGLAAVIAAVESDLDWPATCVRFEVAMLAELGYGLDLGRCAVTGDDRDLVFVSPRTGRAVSSAAAAPWSNRLLALPAFLLNPAAPTDAEAIAHGLALTGHFLQRCVYSERGQGLPPARLRLQQLLAGGRGQRAIPPLSVAEAPERG